MTFAKETRPEHCFDWLSAEDLVVMAVRSLTLARRACYPEVGERFTDEDVPWATRDYVADVVGLTFALQVKAHAYRLGIGGDEFEQDAVTWAKWEAPPSPAKTRLECRS